MQNGGPENALGEPVGVTDSQLFVALMLQSEVQSMRKTGRTVNIKKKVVTVLEEMKGMK